MSTTQEFKKQLEQRAEDILSGIQSPLLMQIDLPMTHEPIEDKTFLSYTKLAEDTDKSTIGNYPVKKIHRISEEVNILTLSRGKMNIQPGNVFVNIWPFEHKKRRFYYVCEYDCRTHNFKSRVYEGHFIFNGPCRVF